MEVGQEAERRRGEQIGEVTGAAAAPTVCGHRRRDQMRYDDQSHLHSIFMHMRITVQSDNAQKCKLR